MADNFLEKQMDAYREGRRVVRMQNPALDALLRKVGETGRELPSSEPVKQAQLDAAVRSASYTGNDFTANASEASQSVTVEMADASAASFERLGEIVMSIRLKAAELGLGTAFDRSGADKARAEIRFYKK